MSFLKFRIGNLSQDVKATDLIHFFELPLHYDDEPPTIDLLMDFRTKTCNGYGFLFLPVELRDLVVSKDGAKLKGQKISVRQIQKDTPALIQEEMKFRSHGYLSTCYESCHSDSDSVPLHRSQDSRSSRSHMKGRKGIDLKLPAFASSLKKTATSKEDLNNRERRGPLKSAGDSSIGVQLLSGTVNTNNKRPLIPGNTSVQNSSPKFVDSPVKAEDQETWSVKWGSLSATDADNSSQYILIKKQALLPTPTTPTNQIQSSQESHKQALLPTPTTPSNKTHSPLDPQKQALLPTPTTPLGVSTRTQQSSPQESLALLPGPESPASSEKRPFNFRPPKSSPGFPQTPSPGSFSSPEQRCFGLHSPVFHPQLMQGPAIGPVPCSVPVYPLLTLPPAPQGFVPPTQPHPYLPPPPTPINLRNEPSQHDKQGPHKDARAMYDLVDIAAILTHPKYNRDLPNVINRATNSGVMMIIPGMGVKDSIEAAKISHRHGGQVYFLAGVHPHNSSQWRSETCGQLEQLIKAHTGCVGIGECGLDYNRQFASKEAQLPAFEQQVQLACRLKKALLVHNREATDDVLAILSTYKPQLPPVVIHCFTGTREDALRCLAMGFYIGVTGNIFRDMTVRRMLEKKELPLDRLLLETDSPFMYPNLDKARLDSQEQAVLSQSSRNWHHSVSFERNEPCTLPLITELVAACTKNTPQCIAEITRANSIKVFDIHP